MTWILVVTGASAFTLTALALPIVIRIARRTGFVDLPGPRKSHAAPIPYGGGIAVALGFLLTLAAGMIACTLIAGGQTFGLPREVLNHAPGALSKTFDLLLLGGGALVMLVLGTA